MLTGNGPGTAVNKNPIYRQPMRAGVPRCLVSPALGMARGALDAFIEQAGNRNNKLRARMKWLVDELGFDELQRRILASRRFLLASSSWPGGLPAQVVESGDAPAGAAGSGPISAVGQGTPVFLTGTTAYQRWEQANVVRGAAKGTVSAMAWSRLGDVTSDQFRGLAAITRRYDADVRLTNRQNLVFRGLRDDDLRDLAAFQRVAGRGAQAHACAAKAGVDMLTRVESALGATARSAADAPAAPAAARTVPPRRPRPRWSLRPWTLPWSLPRSWWRPPMWSSPAAQKA